MDDDKIMEIAAKVDSSILDWCQTMDVSPLSLSGIVMARLTCMNDMVNTGEDFRKLCMFISEQTGKNKSQTELPEPTDFSQANQWLEQFRHKRD
jgi:hypothetical protein